MIPLYTVGNKNSRDIGKGNFERAVEKAEKRHCTTQHQASARMEQEKEKD